jgi:hypothetical protein
MQVTVVDLAEEERILIGAQGHSTVDLVCEVSRITRHMSELVILDSL